MLRRLLIYTYSPSYRHNLPKLSPMGCWKNKFDEDTWQYIKFLVGKRDLLPEQYKLLGRRMTDMSFDSNKLFKLILSNNLGIGLTVNQINKVFPGLIPNRGVGRPTG